MKQTIGNGCLMCLGGLLASSTSWAESAINVGVGTAGLVLEYNYQLSSKAHLRGAFHYFTLEEEFDEEGIKYNGELESVHLGAIADFHPFSNGFRLSAGIFNTELGLDLSAQATDEALEIGDGSYSVSQDNSDPLKLAVEIDFAPVSPYFGFGWGNSPGAGLGFMIDVGVLIIGEADINYDASGTATDGDTGLTINVATNAEFQQDLQQERTDLEQEFEDYSLYPIVMLGLSYTF